MRCLTNEGSEHEFRSDFGRSGDSATDADEPANLFGAHSSDALNAGEVVERHEQLSADMVGIINKQNSTRTSTYLCPV